MKTATLGQIQKVLDIVAQVSRVQVQEALESGRLHKALTGEVQVVADDIIRVDRSVRLVYPDWVEGVVHPELDTVGPAEYVIDEGRSLYLHSKQKKGRWINGHELHKHLVDTETIKDCANLADLLEIQKKGIAFFRKHFQGKYVYAWRSVVRDAVGDLHVPYLCEIGGKVILRWHDLDDDWLQDSPALRVA